MTAQLQLDYDQGRGLKPKGSQRMMAEALAWIEANHHGWGYVVERAFADADEHGRVRVKKYMEDLRDGVNVVRLGNAHFKVPNELSAPFGRILAAWFPELEPYIPMHVSKTDGMVIPSRPDWARYL